MQQWSIVVTDRNGNAVSTVGPFVDEARAFNYLKIYYPGSGVIVPHTEVP